MEGIKKGIKIRVIILVTLSLPNNYLMYLIICEIFPEMRVWLSDSAVYIEREIKKGSLN